jgi:hypothetical protein
MKSGKAMIVAIAGAGLFLLTAPAHAQMRHGGGGSRGGFAPGRGAPMGGGFRGAPSGAFRGGPSTAFRGHNGHFHGDGHFHGHGHGHSHFAVGFGFPGWGWGWGGYPYWYPPPYYYPPYGYYAPPAPYYSQGPQQVYNGRVVTNDGGK